MPGTLRLLWWRAVHAAARHPLRNTVFASVTLVPAQTAAVQAWGPHPVLVAGLVLLNVGVFACGVWLCCYAAIFGPARIDAPPG